MIYRSITIALVIAAVASACSHNNAAPVVNATHPYSTRDQQDRSIQSRDESTPHLQAYLGNWQGVPYEDGGLNHRGIDCSGLVYRTFKDLYDVELPRAANQQARIGKKVSLRALRSGDLVFFKTGLIQRHVGIYVGGHRFIHASQSRGVTSDSLENPYWRKRYWKSKRVVTSSSVL